MFTGTMIADLGNTVERVMQDAEGNRWRELHRLPSAEDLDAVAEEERIKEMTNVQSV